MGNTTTVGKNIETLFDGAPSDIDSTTYFPGEILLQGIKIFGAGSAMTIIARDGADDGEVLCAMTDTSGTGLKDTVNFPRWCKPYIKVSECTIPAGGRLILELG